MNVQAITAELTEAERAAVAETCRIFGIPFASWPARLVCNGWLMIAVVRAVNRALDTGRARSPSKALWYVAGDFGLEYESLRKKLSPLGRIFPNKRRRRA